MMLQVSTPGEGWTSSEETEQGSDANVITHVTHAYTGGWQRVQQGDVVLLMVDADADASCSCRLEGNVLDVAAVQPASSSRSTHLDERRLY
jgi:hypothetical protein